jgi:hypothetical protein
MDAPVESLEGRYANLFRVGFNAVEFVIEFGQFFPNAPEQFSMRVITSPVYVREFVRVLEGSVADFEREFGAIPPVGR